MGSYTRIASRLICSTSIKTSLLTYTYRAALLQPSNHLLHPRSTRSVSTNNVSPADGISNTPDTERAATDDMPQLWEQLPHAKSASTFNDQSFSAIQGVDQSSVTANFTSFNQFLYDYLRPLTSRDCVNVELAASYWELVSAVTGLPWWAAIATGTCLFKLLIGFPLLVFRDRAVVSTAIYSHKVASYKVQLRANADQLYKEGALRTRKLREDFYEKRLKMYSKDVASKTGYHPAKFYVALLLTLVCFVSLSFGLREVLGFGAFDFNKFKSFNAEFKDAGMLWFKDLTQADTSGKLGAIMASCYAVNNYINTLRRPDSLKPTRIQTVFKWASRFLVVYGFAISFLIPAGIVLFWTTSAVCTLLQTLFTTTPLYGRTFKIPKVMGIFDKPFQELAQRSKARTTRRFSKLITLILHKR